MSLIDSTRVEHLLSRLTGLREDRTPRWGSMTPLSMVEHLSNALEIAMGLREVRAVVPAILFPVLRGLSALPLPVPPRLPSTPEFLVRGTLPFPEAVVRLKDLLRQFHREVLGDPQRRHLHPVFGPLTRLQWAALQDRHFHHHLRQFGL